MVEEISNAESSPARPFPWHDLQGLSRSAVAVRSAARRQLLSLLDEGRLRQALTELFNIELEGFGEGASGSVPVPAPSMGADVQLSSSLGQFQLSVEPGLAGYVVSRAINHTVRIDAGRALDPALRGAWSAVVAELLRRAGAGEPPVEAPLRDARALWRTEFWVRLDGRAFRGAIALAPQRGAATPRPDLSMPLPITLPVVAGVALSTARELESLQPGDAFVFREQGGLEGLQGACALHCGSYRFPLQVTGQGVVLQPPQPLDYDTSMNDGDDSKTVEEAVLDAPVAVSVELGTVTLKASEWLALQPGDVVMTELPVGAQAVLRAAGRVVARGSLVNVEGQLGVKVEHLPKV